MKKYEFTGETKQAGVLEWNELHRIRAVVDFGEIKAGDLGGWIEKEDNLSHEDESWVSDSAEVYGNARVSGNAWVVGNARASGSAWVSGSAWIGGDARVSGNAEVWKTTHVLVIGPIGSRNDYTTFYRDKDNEITVACGCFLGKLDEFLRRVEEEHGDNKHALVYRAAAETAKAQIDLGEG